VAVVIAAVLVHLVPTRVAAGGAVVCAVALALASDLHGVSLVSGMAVALLIIRRGRARTPGPPVVVRGQRPWCDPR
jgi:hypothetical protein